MTLLEKETTKKASLDAIVLVSKDVFNGNDTPFVTIQICVPNGHSNIIVDTVEELDEIISGLKKVREEFQAKIKESTAVSDG